MRAVFLIHEIEAHVAAGVALALGEDPLEHASHRVLIVASSRHRDEPDGKVWVPQAGLPDAKAMFSRPDGKPIQAGDTLTNAAYTKTLRTIAAQGPRTLLDGPIAERVAARTHDEPRPGTLTTQDLAAYQPHQTDPLCRPYRIYVVCVPPPPSSGVSLLQMLAILEKTDIASRGPSDEKAWHLFAEASRLMYADRDR